MVVNREAHPRQRDPVVIGEFAYRMRKVFRGFKIALAALCLTLVIGLLAVVFMSELARIVTLFSVFTAVMIVFVVTIPFINANYICPACGEPPSFPRYEGGVRLNLAVWREMWRGAEMMDNALGSCGSSASPSGDMASVQVRERE